MITPYSDNSSDKLNTENSVKNPSPNNNKDSTIKDYNHEHFKTKLLEIKDFNEAFELVKEAVDKKFQMHRAGLGLVLQSMPIQLGAYHILGSNMIIMNKAILDIIKSKKSKLEFNSYMFVVLCHEYLHSFGITNESKVRIMTYEICKASMGDDHVSTVMAKYQPWEIFPELRSGLNIEFEDSFEIVKKFDTSTQSYIN